ncbi:hypothetical protein EJ03DRAFT_350800 [Teratosphaeria nubilosa]|uniref:Apple domain-containing protein n=1 Tax=Teratosphaeria nubilosa TaxID=161662 RepID=A0A6G1LAN2_9PEZI|nr:hypothetical protein EJ03DRAFT_350800 [Teratosphaeria nubilosa]
MEIETPQEPQRLSALYQYHNAPEVAPAHGLEYDDAVHPHSDKFPAFTETPAYDPTNYKGKPAFPSDNRPPRIIFGMKIRTFLLVSAAMLCVVVGAAVGGAVGGRSVRNNVISMSNARASNATPTTSATTTPAYSAATPTYEPSNACSNATLYTSSYAAGLTGSATAAGLNFTALCDVSNPLASTKATNITEAYVYSFQDCIETCASYNYLHEDKNCTVAVYRPARARPANCYIGTLTGVTASQLGADRGTDVALLASL